MTIQAEVMKVSPEMAERFLGGSNGNRTISAVRVNEWVAEMNAGAWRLGPTIAFDEAGHLVDGHHRLSAVVRFGQPVEFLVIHGLGADVADIVDDGRPRSFGDVLKRQGVPDASAKAAVTEKLLRYDRGLLFSTGGQQGRMNRAAQLAAWAAYRKEVEEAVGMGQKIDRGIRLQRSLASTLYIILARLDQEYATDFFDRLISGADGEEDHPIHQLRAQLLKDALHRREGGRHAYMNETRKAAIVFKAWNYWLEDRRIRALFWRSVGPHAEPFPVPNTP